MNFAAARVVLARTEHHSGGEIRDVETRGEIAIKAARPAIWCFSPRANQRARRKPIRPSDEPGHRAVLVATSCHLICAHV